MSVVYEPPRNHACSPGWTWRESTGKGFGAPPRGMMIGKPPTPWDYPRGTVWQCECGKTWVSQGSPYINAPGMCTFRREGRFERRRRERRQAASAVPPGLSRESNPASPERPTDG